MRTSDLLRWALFGALIVGGILFLVLTPKAHAQQTYSLLVEWSHTSAEADLVNYFEVGWRHVLAADIGQGTSYSFPERIQTAERSVVFSLPKEIVDGDRIAWSVRACNVTNDCSQWPAEQRLDFYAADAVALPDPTVLPRPSLPTELRSTFILD